MRRLASAGSIHFASNYSWLWIMIIIEMDVIFPIYYRCFFLSVIRDWFVGIYILCIYPLSEYKASICFYLYYSHRIFLVSLIVSQDVVGFCNAAHYQHSKEGKIRCKATLQFASWISIKRECWILLVFASRRLHYNWLKSHFPHENIPSMTRILLWKWRVFQFTKECSTI